MSEYIDLNKAVDKGYLGDWYQSSIDETVPPIWTDEHIEELCNDFIIIPKDTPPIKIPKIKHGEWILERKIDEKTSDYKCSNCDFDVTLNNNVVNKFYNYCPYCGNKMNK